MVIRSVSYCCSKVLCLSNNTFLELVLSNLYYELFTNFVSHINA